MRIKNSHWLTLKQKAGIRNAVQVISYFDFQIDMVGLFAGISRIVTKQASKFI